MKKTILRLIPVIAVSLLQACSGSKTGSSGDTSTVKKDSTSVTTVASADTASAMSDTAFANKAAVGGMAEVARGKMAAAKGASKEVKDFGNMMVMDHGKANDELKGIAQKKNITLPAGLDAEHQAKSDSLSKLSGAAFDKAYVAAMVEGHKKTLALMQSEARGGKDADLKGFAAKTAPVVQHHLDEITKIQASLK